MNGLALSAFLLVQGAATSQTISTLPGPCTGGEFGILRIDDGSAPTAPVVIVINGTQATSSQPRALCPVSNIQAFRDNTGGLRPGPTEIKITQIPLGYYLKSMTVGNIDMTKGAVDLPANVSSPKVEVVLTKTRPAGTPPGAKVSGRILGLDMPRRADIQLVLTSVSTPPGMPARSGESPVLANGQTGAFVIPDLSPGSYKLQLARLRLPGYALGLDSDFAGAAVTFDVGGSDITNLEIKFEPTASRPAKPE